MTTIDTRAETITDDTGTDTTTDEPFEAGEVLLSSPVAHWLISADHKRIGRTYLGAAFLTVITTIVVNILLAIERTDGDSVVLDENVLAQLLDAQRVGLVFGTLLPLAMALCVIVVPLQIGARSLAFPRMAAVGFWIWFGGAVAFAIALANNGGSLGGSEDMVSLFFLGVGTMAVGLTATAASIVTSVLTTRAPGMTLRRTPFFTWSAMIFSLGVIVVMPVLVGALTYLFMDHRYPREGFGGNAGFYTWAGWILTQPATYLFAIPAIGVFAELLPVVFGKRAPARGVMIAGLGLVGVAALSAVTQQNIQNLPWEGGGFDTDNLGDKFQDLAPYVIFNAIPIAGLLLVFLMGLFLAKPDDSGFGFFLTSSFLFAFFGFGMILVGMIGGIMYALDDLGVQGTVFEEAVIVYVAYGGVLGIMGGIAHWVPKWRGGTFPVGIAVPLALLGVLATILASFPHYIAGLLDQEGGLFYSDNDLLIWNVLVLVGHGLMLAVVLIFIAALVLLVKADPDGNDAADPWNAQTVEWTTTSPAPPENFVDLPMVHSAEPAYDLDEQRRASAAADGGGS